MATQHRTPSPSTQSGASVEFSVVILVLSKHFFVFSARVSLKQRAIKTRTPTRHRRIITPRSGLGTFSARLVFWKAEIEARTSVPLPGTCGSHRARPVRIFHGAFHTTVSTGSEERRSSCRGGLSKPEWPSAEWWVVVKTIKAPTPLGSWDFVFV